MSFKYFMFWVPMIVIAIANGMLRQFALMNYMNQLSAHQLSTLILIALCSMYIWLVFPLLDIKSVKQAVLTGAIWVVLTILFEFSLGRLVNRSWESLLQDYNIIEGRIWPFFLYCLLFLPYVVYVLKK
ncbi:MAG TPA: hypothetical protein VFV68_08170 [Agriterribacter sp.]|nr:hypothetical protein [Agriterribacter sp.]